MPRLLKLMLLLCAIQMMIMTAALVMERRGTPDKIMLVKSSRGGGQALYAFEPNRQIARPLTRQYKGMDSFYRPDTGWAYYFASPTSSTVAENVALYRLNLSTRVQEQVVNEVAPWQIMWGAFDGTGFMYYTEDDDHRTQVYHVSLESGEQQAIQLPDGISFFRTQGWPPSVYPLENGDKIFLGREGSTPGIYRMSADGENVHQLVPLQPIDLPVSLTIYREWIFYQNDHTRYRVRLDGSDLAEFPQNIEMDDTFVLVNLAIEYDQLMVSTFPASMNLASDFRQQWQAFDLHSDGSEPVWTLTYRGAGNSPWVAPDGEGYLYIDESNGGSNLFRMRPDGTEQQQLTHLSIAVDYLQSSHDGKWLLFAATERGRLYRSSLYRVRPDGSELKKITEINNLQWLEWSEDDRWIYYHRRIGTNSAIYRLRLDGSQHERLTSRFHHEELWGWMPMPEMEWQPALLLGGGLGLIGIMGMRLFAKKGH